MTLYTTGDTTADAAIGTLIVLVAAVALFAVLKVADRRRGK